MKKKKRLSKVSKLLLLILVCFSLYIGLSYSLDNNVNEDKKVEKIDPDKEANKILEKMSLKDKIGQMIIVDSRTWNGTNLYELKKEQLDFIKKYSIGGFILFDTNINTVEQTIKFNNNLNLNSKYPMFIGVDQEGGSIVRISYANSYVGNMALASTKDIQNTYKQYKGIGEELYSLGFNLDFAPVMDVNTNPNNPVIGIRSFSDDKDIVSKNRDSAVKGLNDANIISSLKHFPGHGDTETDSHTGLPLVNTTLDALKNNELIPFKDSNSDMIMTAHIQLPNVETNKYFSKKLNKEVYLPSTLSKTIITDILRNELNYKGLVITDALDMDAISKTFDSLDAAKLAINAGVDILLMPVAIDSEKNINNLISYIESIEKMVNDNEINLNTINDSVLRIIKTKLKYNIMDKNGKVIENKDTLLDRKINAKKTIDNNKELSWDLALKSITNYKNDNPYTYKESDVITIVTPYSNEKSMFDLALQKLNIKNKINYIYIKDHAYTNYLEIINNSDLVIIMSETTKNSSFSWQYTYIYNLIKYLNDKKINNYLISSALPYDVKAYDNAKNIYIAYSAKSISPNVSGALYKIIKNEECNSNVPVKLYEFDRNNLKFIYK